MITRLAVLVSIYISFALPLTGTVPAFTPHVNYRTGTNPQSIAAADLNGDGITDLAVVNTDDNSISVFLNTGEGILLPTRADYTVGSSPQSLTIADMNGDGKLDLVVANTGDYTITILYGEGDGTFPKSTTYATEFAPISVVTTDLDGDSQPDLIVAQFYVNGVCVLLSSEQFQTCNFYRVGTQPYTVAIGDFNNDDRKDVVTSNGDGTSSVLLGRGSGEFQDALTTAVYASSIGYVGVSDLNEDGIPDLAFSVSGQGLIAVRLGDGTGNFGPSMTFATGSGFPEAIAMADFDGDGHLDVAVADDHAATVSLLLGDGKGGLGTAQQFLTGASPHGLVAADFDNDRKPDLAVVNRVSSDVSILLNTNRNSMSLIGLPVIFVHGFCGGPEAWLEVEEALRSYLVDGYSPLYDETTPNYYAFLTGNTVYFEDAATHEIRADVEDTARFFEVAFADPQEIRPPFDSYKVANVSVLDKAEELARIIWQVKKDTHAPRVILVTHSMGGLVARVYAEGLRHSSVNTQSSLLGPYYQDLALLTTIDAPNGGSSAAGILPLDLGPCYARDSVNRRELSPTSKVISTLNYQIPGAAPLPDGLTVDTIESYWTFSYNYNIWPYTLASDNILLATEQNLVDNLIEPSKNSFSRIVTLYNPYNAEFGHPICGGLRPLHLLSCVALNSDNPQTIRYLGTSIARLAVMSESVEVTPQNVSVKFGTWTEFKATTQSKAGVTWSVLEGANAGLITQAGRFLALGKPGTYHVVAVDQSRLSEYGTATVVIQ